MINKDCIKCYTEPNHKGKHQFLKPGEERKVFIDAPIKGTAFVFKKQK